MKPIKNRKREDPSGELPWLPEKEWCESYLELAGEVDRGAGMVREYLVRAGIKKTKKGWPTRELMKWMVGRGFFVKKKYAPGKGTVVDRINYRMMKEKYAAKKAQLEWKEAVGKVMPVAKVQERDVARIHAVKRHAMALPKQVCNVLVGLTAREIETVLLKKMRALCTKFSEM